MSKSGVYTMGAIETVCWFVAREGGWIDLDFSWSARTRKMIDAALKAGAIHSGGGLTETGERYAEGVRRG